MNLWGRDRDRAVQRSPAFELLDKLLGVGIGDVDVEFALEHRFGGEGFGHFGKHLILRGAHHFQLPVKGLVGTELGLGLGEFFLRLRFARGSVAFRYGWRGDQLLVLGPADAADVTGSYLPVAAAEFASFGFAGGKATRVRFEADGAGKVTGLTFGAGDAAVTARRLEG